jgi:hypothetical protein
MAEDFLSVLERARPGVYVVQGRYCSGTTTLIQRMLHVLNGKFGSATVLCAIKDRQHYAECCPNTQLTDVFEITSFPFTNDKKKPDIVVLDDCDDLLHSNFSGAYIRSWCTTACLRQLIVILAFRSVIQFPVQFRSHVTWVFIYNEPIWDFVQTLRQLDFRWRDNANFSLIDMPKWEKQSFVTRNMGTNQFCYNQPWKIPGRLTSEQKLVLHKLFQEHTNLISCLSEMVFDYLIPFDCCSHCCNIFYRW